MKACVSERVSECERVRAYAGWASYRDLEALGCDDGVLDAGVEGSVLDARDQEGWAPGTTGGQTIPVSVCARERDTQRERERDGEREKKKRQERLKKKEIEI